MGKSKAGAFDTFVNLYGLYINRGRTVKGKLAFSREKSAPQARPDRPSPLRRQRLPVFCFNLGSMMV